MRAILAASIILGAVSSAPGGIVWLPNQEIPIPTTFEGVAVDLETGAFETDLDGVVGGDANFVLAGAGISNDADQSATMPSWQPLRTGTNNTDPVVNLTVGATVDGTSSSYAAGFGGSGDPNSHFPGFLSGTSGYLGFSLVLDNSDVVYGWMRVTLRDDNAAGGMIHEWAYESSGGAIEVGAIPEPSSALLLLGALTFALRRKR